MIKRVLLINPPDTRPPDMLADKVRIGVVAPLGLAYIAAVLEQQGIEVCILDCVADGYGQSSTGKLRCEDGEIFLEGNGEVRYGLEDIDIAKRIGDYAPDLVGVSCLFSNKAWDAHNVCRIAKLVNPDIITVMGGAHPTALPDETLLDSNIDRVFSGEGEYLLKDFVTGDYSDGGVIDNLDSLPFPARHLLNMPKYLYSASPHSGLKRQPVATMSTSRGCPGRCEFCAIRGTFGDAWRPRSPENVLAEIDHLVSTYKIKELHFEDDCLTTSKKRAMAIFQGIIERKYDLSLNSPSGLAVFAMDEELLEKMKEAGYYSISLAIESGVPEVLKLMHKHVDHAKATRLIRYARDIGLKVKCFWILGYPGESIDTMKQTVDVAYQMGADWNLFFPATTLPGTEMDKRVRTNGWLVDPNLDYRRYFFTPNIKTDKFTPEDVIRIKDDANEHLNFRDNINYREGRYNVALQDFEEIHRLYPDLHIAKEMIEKCQQVSMTEHATL